MSTVQNRIKVERIVQLPNSKAFKISMQSIRIRFWRSMITAGGVFLGIAFLSTVLITTPLENAAGKEKKVQLGLLKKVYTVNDFSGHKVVLDGAELKVDDKLVVVTENAFQLGAATVTLDEVKGKGEMRYEETMLAKSTKKEQREKEAEDARQANARRLWLVVMSLLVCTVGITNAMMMSVTERFRDIGTMKCLGALDMFIVKLFVFEAIFLGFLASVMGFAVGFIVMALAYWARAGFVVLSTLHGLDVLVIFGQCVGIGIFLTTCATIWPAVQASKLPPAAALRSSI